MKNNIKYKEILINGCRFVIRKYKGNNNKLIYSVRANKGNGNRYIGSYNNPREAMYLIKMYARLYERY